MLVDTHAHIHDPAFAGDPGVVDRARAAGVTRIVDIGCDEETTRAAVAAAEAHPGVWAVIGIHPHEADRYAGDETLRVLRPFAAHPKVVAVGEIGLDYAKMHSTRENQHVVFRRQLRFAREIGKPVVIHCRDAYGDLKRIVREELTAPVRGVMHCFSGAAGDARDFLDLGFVLSIAGPVTFNNAGAFRDIVKTIPLDRLVVETDCPYLTPAPHRGKRNEPAYVRHTAERVAELKGITLEAFAERSTATAMALFGLP